MPNQCKHGNHERSFIRKDPNGRWGCRQCHRSFATIEEAIATGAGVDVTPEPEKTPLELLAESWESSARSCRSVTADPFTDDHESLSSFYEKYDAKAEVYEECAKELRKLIAKMKSNE